MSRFLVDENLPRSLAKHLHAAGLDATDVRDLELRGKPDREVFGYAIGNDYVIVTKDRGFGNTMLHPLASRHGIVLVRYVRDTGFGIAEEDQHIFSRFFQVDSGLSRARGGVGLGLAIAKAIVESHGGRIGVMSELVKVSTFWFDLTK